MTKCFLEAGAGSGQLRGRGRGGKDQGCATVGRIRDVRVPGAGQGPILLPPVHEHTALVGLGLPPRNS